MQIALTGKRALVTGGAGGIGGAIAAALAAEGIAVAVADTRAPRQGRGVHFMGMDVRDRTSVLHGISAVEDVFGGPIDILVNAAGIYPCDPILEMTEESWDRVMDINVKGMFLVSQAVCRRLVEAQQPGCIVNITSGAAERARLGAAHYCTSKSAAEMLTRTFALEFAEHQIRVNAVAPGYVEVGSDINPVSETYKQAIIGGIPLGCAGQPDDVARTVLFLCSDAAKWITGGSYRVDGGSRAGTLALPLSRAN
ncbi:MAG TPA: SDR family oxidoreductase [Rhodopila sp.]|jgi:3-oxoacyl-[acyl-carrier protein] reductase|nr:SDR family oxidoreductase [Rhodopila sp.]